MQASSRLSIIAHIPLTRTRSGLLATAIMLMLAHRLPFITYILLTHILSDFLVTIGLRCLKSEPIRRVTPV
jgi:hypothetical protein